jgi:acetyltransferase-like isoleucine patch superfamily enzyme
MVLSSFYLSLKNIIELFAVDVNPFSRRRKRPAISRKVEYTRDVLKGNNYEIGEFTYGIPTVFAGFLHPEVKLKIGRFCSIAEGVTIYLGGSHRTNLVTTYPFGAFPDDWPKAEQLRYEDVGAVSRGDVVIGNDVWIGHRASILSGVTIGDGAVIGAESVVVNDVQPYSIVAGNPARLIRKRFDEETIRKLSELKWWDWPIEKIGNNLNVICSNNVSDVLRIP